MQIADIPPKFQKAFGVNASAGNIRSIPVTTADPNAASLNLGWPPSTFTAQGAGGVPPDGRDMNGIHNQVTAWLRYLAAGGVVQYDATFSAAIGGYPKWSLVGSVTNPGTYWQSTADNNTTNPDAAGAGWQAWPASGSIPWSAPPPIGNVTPNSGKFTSLIAIGNFNATGYISGNDLQINGVGFTTVLGGTGYQKLPSGLIIQWSRTTLSTGNGDVLTFPIPFPNNCAISFDVGNDGSGAEYTISGSLSGPPYTGVTVWARKSGSFNAAGVSYIAIGN